jgi:hypothetical protein
MDCTKGGLRVGGKIQFQCTLVEAFENQLSTPIPHAPKYFFGSERRFFRNL